MRSLLDSGADPDKIYAVDSYSPLLLAAYFGHTETAGALLEDGADPEIEHPVNKSFALLMAVERGHAACARVLLAAGSDPNREQTGTGSFPLLVAAEKGDIDCVRVLLENGANPYKIRRSDGSSPLQRATSLGHEACAQALAAARGDWRQAVNSAVITKAAPPDPSIAPSPGDVAKTSAGPRRWAKFQIPLPGAGRVSSVAANEPPRLISISFAQDEIPDVGISSGVWLRRLPTRREAHVATTIRVLQGSERFVAECGWLCFDPSLEFYHLPLVRPFDRSTVRPFDWDALALSLSNADSPLRPQADEGAELLTALFLLFGDAPRSPVLRRVDLPTSSDGKLPKSKVVGEDWRTWIADYSRGGVSVELPWIEGRNLVRGRVLIPKNGVGIKVVGAPTLIFEDVDWATPSFLYYEDGSHSPFWNLGIIDVEPSA